MYDRDRELLEDMLRQGGCWQGAILYGQVFPRQDPRSFIWDLRNFKLAKPNTVHPSSQKDLSQVFPTDYSNTSFFFSSIPHNSTCCKAWLDFSMAMGYMPENKSVVIMPPGLGEKFSPDTLEEQGIDIIYMEHAGHPIRDITNGDVSFPNRLSSQKIPEYRLSFHGKLPLNIAKLLERNTRRLIAEKLRYAFRSSFVSGNPGGRDPERDSWDVFQHARNISLGHFSVDEAKDLPPESKWERRMLDLLTDTDLRVAEVGKLQDALSAIVAEMETYEKFWLEALENSPVAPMMYRFQDANSAEIEEWAEILGVKPLIESYVEGVSAEDVIGGEIKHKNLNVKVEL